MPLTERRRAARHRRALAYWGVMLSLWLSLWVGAAVVPAEWLHLSMLFVHLASIIVGLGAAVFLEFNGLLWMIGRRTLADLRHTEQSVSALAWLGILGLFFSGAFLAPNLEDPLTVIKMTAVLVVAMNGVAMTRLTADLARLPATIPFRRVPRRVQLWCVWSALVSQAAWWTAVIIGMLNTAT